MAQWLALLPHSARDSDSIPVLGHCAEFAHSPRVCVGFLWVLTGFLPHSIHMWVKLIDHVKLPLSVREISRVNTSGYGDRALGGILVGADPMGRNVSFSTVGIL